MPNATCSKSWTTTRWTGNSPVSSAACRDPSRRSASRGVRTCWKRSRFDLRYALRALREVSRLHRGCRSDAGAWCGRQHCNLLRRQRRDATAASVRRPRPSRQDLRRAIPRAGGRSFPPQIPTSSTGARRPRAGKRSPPSTAAPFRWRLMPAPKSFRRFASPPTFSPPWAPRPQSVATSGPKRTVPAAIFV